MHNGKQRVDKRTENKSVGTLMVNYILYIHFQLLKLETTSLDIPSQKQLTRFNLKMTKWQAPCGLFKYLWWSQSMI